MQCNIRQAIKGIGKTLLRENNKRLLISSQLHVVAVFPCEWWASPGTAGTARLGAKESPTIRSRSLSGDALLCSDWALPPNTVWVWGGNKNDCAWRWDVGNFFWGSRRCMCKAGSLILSTMHPSTDCLSKSLRRTVSCSLTAHHPNHGRVPGPQGGQPDSWGGRDFKQKMIEEMKKKYDGRSKNAQISIFWRRSSSRVSFLRASQEDQASVQDRWPYARGQGTGVLAGGSQSPEWQTNPLPFRLRSCHKGVYC